MNTPVKQAVMLLAIGLGSLLVSIGIIMHLQHALVQPIAFVV